MDADCDWDCWEKKSVGPVCDKVVWVLDPVKDSTIVIDDEKLMSELLSLVDSDPDKDGRGLLGESVKGLLLESVLPADDVAECHGTLSLDEP